MTMNTVYVAHEIVIAVWQALAQAAPERACAAWSKTMHGHVAGKRDDGTTWVNCYYARKPIPKDQELLVNYGRRYWKTRTKVDL